ncbi:MAG: cysteine--tRNA ligase, partial [Perlabentimonas sp.]
STYKMLVFDVLGLADEQTEGSKHAELTGKLIEMLLNMRLQAKSNKDFETSDRIRDELNKLGVTVKDRKDGFDWELS